MSNLRVTRADLFDAEIRPHNERFRAVAAIDRDDRVLDVGCGTGESTRQAARVATAGSVLSVDISGDALALARRISADEYRTGAARGCPAHPARLAAAGTQRMVGGCV